VASRLAGATLPERVTGQWPRLEHARRSRTCPPGRYSFWGTPRGGRRRRRPTEARCPGLQGVDSYCPPLGFEDDPAELARIKKALHGARPALVLIGLGFPKQERLIRLLRSEFPPVLVRGRRDIAQLPRRGAAARAYCAATPRSRVASPPLARAPSTVQAVRHSRSPVRPQAPRLGARAASNARRPRSGPTTRATKALRGGSTERRQTVEVGAVEVHRPLEPLVERRAGPPVDRLGGNCRIGDADAF
jgi:Glycosyl transferase WecG/TagA/CpsF family